MTTCTPRTEQELCKGGVVDPIRAALESVARTQRESHRARAARTQAMTAAYELGASISAIAAAADLEYSSAYRAIHGARARNPRPTRP